MQHTLQKPKVTYSDIRLLDLKHKEISVECNISRERKLSIKFYLFVGSLITAKLWTQLWTKFLDPPPSPYTSLRPWTSENFSFLFYKKGMAVLTLVAHILKLDQYRDQHGPCARMSGKHILLFGKQISNKDILYSTGTCSHYLGITFNGSIICKNT